ncbi:hypothetical protein EZV62_009129 [Acer yangbiense]|uniref:Rab-GAP TBC domain-containing protein n=1 Tax=Acer yangbiense TaxID=1000413 RepID=A0A5C7IFT2_9ROSI|nr:hypothetical protein EZV62_009129 [Acer yangbiense]
MWGAPAEPADGYYEPGKTLSARKWRAAFTPEGYLDLGKTLGRIQRGGIHPSIRGEVWEFLLGCYDPKSTFDERDQTRKRRRLQYAQWKEGCHEIFPVIGSGKFITAPVITEDGIHGSISHMVKKLLSNGALDKKVIQWLLTLHQIGLDVVRTDRTLVFYEKQEHLSKLWDILAVYAWIDEDVGYCQGMSDLCSPMIMLLDDEADAFWCFERLMRRLRGNFRCTESSVGVEAQLGNLAAVTQVIDPKLHQHLETLGGGDYLFAVRMLMVLFRREFSFCDSLYLWEFVSETYRSESDHDFLTSCTFQDLNPGPVAIPTQQLKPKAFFEMALDLIMMWALEYDPDLFHMYEEPESADEKAEGSKGKAKSFRQCGKFERENMRNGKSSEAPLPISVFLVASVLKDKSSKLLQEARGLDDVVKILNDITGNLDAKKACTGAMKLHKKYLKKAKQT